MKTRGFSLIELLVVIAVVAVLAAMVTGCSLRRSVGTLAESQQQAQLATVTEDVRLAAAARGDVLFANFLSEVPKLGGAAGYTERREPLKNPDGSYLLDENGNVQYGHCVAIGLCASMRDIAGFDEAMLVLGGQAINPKDGKIEPGPYLNGLFAYLTGKGVSSGPSAAFAKVWADATVGEKQAAADAVARSLEAWKGLIVEGVTATGEQARGVLKEVLRATPAGVAAAAVDVVLQTVDGKRQEATITAPFVSVPASAQAKEAQAPAASK